MPKTCDIWQNVYEFLLFFLVCFVKHALVHHFKTSLTIKRFVLGLVTPVAHFSRCARMKDAGMRSCCAKYLLEK